MSGGPLSPTASSLEPSLDRGCMRKQNRCSRPCVSNSSNTGPPYRGTTGSSSRKPKGARRSAPPAQGVVGPPSRTLTRRLVGPTQMGEPRAFAGISCGVLPAVAHTSIEMAFCEGSARSGFQILLEPRGVCLVGEFNHDVGPSRSVLRSVGTVSLVVPGQPLLHVARNPDVIPRSPVLGLEYVDESLESHPTRRGKFIADGNVPIWGVAMRRNAEGKYFCACRSVVDRTICDSPRSACRAEARRSRAKAGGPDRDRTGDLVNAIHARSQLRHWPLFGCGTNPYCSGRL